MFKSMLELCKEYLEGKKAFFGDVPHDFPEKLQNLEFFQMPLIFNGIEIIQTLLIPHKSLASLLFSSPLTIRLSQIWQIKNLQII